MVLKLTRVAKERKKNLARPKILGGNNLMMGIYLSS
jgi:hypothetical protein